MIKTVILRTLNNNETYIFFSKPYCEEYLGKTLIVLNKA
jgi:hypothetical protein